MSTDFVSLRLLAALRSPDDREALRAGAALAQTPCDVVAAADVQGVRDALAVAETDIVLIDAALAPAQRAQMTAAARAARAARGQPFIVLVGADDHADDADAVLEAPVQPARVTALIACYARAQISTRAMIVDDSPTMRGIVKKILNASRFPFDIAEADDGTTALAAVRDGWVDIVFLDYNMPGLNGRETLGELKKIAPETAVVMMTATSDDALEALLVSEGATSLLKKPFFPIDIDAVMHMSHGIAPTQRRPQRG